MATNNNIERRENDVKANVNAANELHNKMMECSSEFSLLQSKAERLCSRYRDLLITFESEVITYKFSRPFRWGESRRLQDRLMRKEIRYFRNSMDELMKDVSMCRIGMTQIIHDISRYSVHSYTFSKKLRGYLDGECSDDEREVAVRMASFLDSEVKWLNDISIWSKEIEAGLRNLEIRISALTAELFNAYTVKSVVNRFEMVKQKVLI